MASGQQHLEEEEDLQVISVHSNYIHTGMPPHLPEADMDPKHEDEATPTSVAFLLSDWDGMASGFLTALQASSTQKQDEGCPSDLSWPVGKSIQTAFAKV